MLYGENMKSNARILIVDDEALTLKQLKSQINKMGYKHISLAVSYDKAMKSIENEIPDLILLDINLESDYNGIDLANEKEVLNKIPIIYITGGTNSQTKKNLIATSPKIFLLKPIRVEELEINIDLALGSKKGVIDIGYDFSYDLENRHLFYKNRYVKLSKNEKLLLEKLIEAKGKVVLEEVLKFAVWGNEPIAKNSLRMLIGSLRTKLRDKRDSKMIVNTSSHGYRLPLPEDEI